MTTNEIEVGYSGDPPNGAVITWQGDHWDLDMSTWGGMSSGDASAIVSSRNFDMSGGLFNGSVAIWNSANRCFYSMDLGRCLETKTATPGHWEHHTGGWTWVGSGKPTSPPPSLAPPVHTDPASNPPPVPPNVGPGHYEHRPKGWVWVADPPPPPPAAQPSPMPTSPPANAGPGHWEHRPKGWVWISDSVASTVKDAMKSTAQQDVERGYTFYLCPIDEYGRQLSCSTLTQAQAELAVATAEATPVIAEDRKAGVIKPIDPLGKYGPRPTYPQGMLNALTVSLNQWNAINAAILANPAAGTPIPPGSTSPAHDGTTQDSLDTNHKKVDIGVRILEGLAAIAGVFVSIKIWKHYAKKGRAA